MSFADRAAAGRAVARALAHLAGRDDLLVLGLPRGGVPVAAEVAAALGAPLDVLVVRKIGAPGRSELALGAIASGGVRVLNQDVAAAYALSESEIDRLAADEEVELRRREAAYRGPDRPAPDLRGRTVVLVDDGLATGASMRVAVQAVKTADPARVIVAVPVAARATCEDMQRLADEVVCVHTPASFLAVGQWYDDFSQTSDSEVRELLADLRR